MTDYQDELAEFERQLGDETGPKGRAAAATDRIYGSSIYEQRHGRYRERDHRPGDVSTIPLEDGKPYGLRIEVDVGEDLDANRFEELLEQRWDEPRYEADTECESVRNEYHERIKGRFPRASPLLRPLFDLQLRLAAWEDAKDVPDQIEAYTVADRGPGGEEPLPDAEKTTIGLIDGRESRYIRILPEDRSDPETALDAAAEVATWLDETR